MLDFFIALRREIEDEDFLTIVTKSKGGHWMEKTEKGTTHRERHTSRSTNLPRRTNIYLHEADLWIERKMQERKMKVSVRYADGEYAAEQPQGLPAVIAELTRWAAQNLELTLKSEINVGSRLSEKRRLKRRITKCNKGRTKRLREGRSESIRMETRRRGEREIFEPDSHRTAA